MTLVDTSVWIDFFNGVQAERTDRLAHLLENEPVLLGDLIYCEVLQGFRFDRDVETARHETSSCQVHSTLPVGGSLQVANAIRSQH